MCAKSSTLVWCCHCLGFRYAPRLSCNFLFLGMGGMLRSNEKKVVITALKHWVEVLGVGGLFC